MKGTEMTEKIKKYNIGFTQVANYVLLDDSLSLRAKGLYAYLFSKPDGWEFHLDIMEQELKESKGQIYSILKELINKGYIKRIQKNENGRFGGIVYEFIENPHPENPNTEIPYTEKPAYGKTHTHNNIYNINNTYIKEKENIKEKEILQDVPSYLQEALMTWLEYKKERKQSYKPIGLKRLIADLKEWSAGDEDLAMEIVNQSIRNNYSGLFKLSKNGKEVSPW